MKKLTIVAAFTISLFSCKKETEKKKDLSQEISLSWNQENDENDFWENTNEERTLTIGYKTSVFFWFHDAGDGDTIKPNVMVKVWYTDTLNSERLVEKFQNDINNNYTDLQNNTKANFYKRNPDRKFYISKFSDVYKNNEVRKILVHNRWVMMEFNLIPNQPQATQNKYNWRYLKFIHRKGKPYYHYRISTDAFRAGL